MRSNVLTLFLKLLGVRHTSFYAGKLYDEHPFRNSLFGLSEMLSEYGVRSTGLKPENRQDILTLSTPFIAHAGEDFVIVNKIEGENIYYIADGKSVLLPFEKFDRIWSGFLLVAEKNKDSREPAYSRNLREGIISGLKKWLLGLSFFLILLLLYLKNNLSLDGRINILLLINLIGGYITLILFLKQLRPSDRYGNKVCSFFKQGDCNNILDSDAAKIAGISWSEVGLGYFCSNILLLLIFPAYIRYLALINMCLLPFTLWSVWFQKFKVRQWCTLCLLVQLVLWGIFLFNLFGCNIVFLFRISDVPVLFCIYILPVLTLNRFSCFYMRSGRLESALQLMNGLKFHENIFETLLQQQPCYPLEGVSAIVFGHPDSPMVVTVVTNPHCNPCAMLHGELDELLNTSGYLKIRYVFFGFGSALEESCKMLIAAYLQQGEKRGLEIFKEWFKEGRYNKKSFFKKYCLEIGKPEVIAEFDKHKRCIAEMNISDTPTVLVNGYQLPEYYQVKDLRYI